MCSPEKPPENYKRRRIDTSASSPVPSNVPVQRATPTSSLSMSSASFPNVPLSTASSDMLSSTMSNNPSSTSSFPEPCFPDSSGSAVSTSSRGTSLAINPTSTTFGFGESNNPILSASSAMASNPISGNSSAIASTINPTSTTFSFGEVRIPIPSAASAVASMSNPTSSSFGLGVSSNPMATIPISSASSAVASTSNPTSLTFPMTTIPSASSAMPGIPFSNATSTGPIFPDPSESTVSTMPSFSASGTLDNNPIHMLSSTLPSLTSNHSIQDATATPSASSAMQRFPMSAASLQSTPTQSTPTQSTPSKKRGLSIINHDLTPNTAKKSRPFIIWEQTAYHLNERDAEDLVTKLKEYKAQGKDPPEKGVRLKSSGKRVRTTFYMVDEEAESQLVLKGDKRHLVPKPNQAEFADFHFFGIVWDVIVFKALDSSSTDILHVVMQHLEGMKYYIFDMKGRLTEIFDHLEFYKNQLLKAVHEDAKATAEDAKATAEDAKATAGDAKVTAEDAKVTAEDAKATAGDAKVTAEDAKATAGDAKVTAEDAKASSKQAETKADRAQATADNTKIEMDRRIKSLEVNQHNWNTQSNSRCDDLQAQFDMMKLQSQAEHKALVDFQTRLALQLFVQGGAQTDLITQAQAQQISHNSLATHVQSLDSVQSAQQLSHNNLVAQLQNVQAAREFDNGPNKTFYYSRDCTVNVPMRSKALEKGTNEYLNAWSLLVDLRKLEKSPGIVYRGINLQKLVDLGVAEEFLKMLKVGGTYMDLGFMSTSKNFEQAWKFSNPENDSQPKRIILRIEHVTGRDIVQHAASEYEEEEEVLVEPEVPFDVLSSEPKDHYGESYDLWHLREVTTRDPEAMPSFVVH